MVCGGFTRLAQFYLLSEKVYEGTIRFGFSTDTYDAEGEPTSEPRPVELTREILEEQASRFCGVIEQFPPPFSAKKIKGVPAYKLARKQKDVTLKPVQVEIKELQILSMEGDRAQFRARVGSGTYMRSVAHDLGRALGCGAHLEKLRRTSAGEFKIEDAHTLEEIAAAAGNCLASLHRVPMPASAEPMPETLDELFIHPRKLLPEFPSVTADEQTVARIRSGLTVNLPELSRARQVKVFAGQRELVAIATRVAGTLFHAKVVLYSTSTERAPTPA